MRSTVEPLEGNKVKVAVELDAAELEPAVDAAWREIAKEVRLPGFRPGKAPRKLLEKQFGSGYARSEALRNALPEFYSRAVIEHDVDVIAPPELDITAGEEAGDVAFEALVEVRPTVRVAGYAGLRVEVPSPEVPDEDVEEQIDRLRSQYGELVEVDRDVAEGDYVTIDLTGSQDGEVVDGLSADDYLYLVGSGMIASELDEHLVGAAVGAELSFDADHPDPEQGTVQFRVVVKGVKERVLPDLDDDWVAEATEFDTVEELRADTRSRLAEQREQQTRLAVRNNLGAELAKLVDDDVPEALVASEVQMRLQNMAYQLQGRGIGLDDYLRITGRDPEGFTAELKEAAEEAVRVDLALRAVAELEGIVATDDEVAHEVSHLIAGSDMTVEEAIEELRAGGQLSAVRSDIVKRNALEWLVERSEVVDPDGTPVPAELLALPDHDHDHADGDEHGEAPTDPGEDDDA